MRTQGLPEKFGTIQQEVPEDATRLLALLPESARMANRSRFDVDVFVPLMSVIAGVVVDAFRAKLEGLFPEARVLSSVFEWQPSDKIALFIAPVKGEARVRAKVQEYADEFGHDIAKWPFVQCVGDLVRASIVCADMDGAVAAWQDVEQGFGVRDGHGRLKNNWFTREPRPPDMLVNVVVDVPDAPSITGEIQIHLHDILLAKEEGVYEAVNAQALAATYIGLHNDATWALTAPFAAFVCFEPAPRGGAFLVADGRRVLAELDPALVDQFCARNVTIRVVQFDASPLLARCTGAAAPLRAPLASAIAALVGAVPSLVRVRVTLTLTLPRFKGANLNP